MNGVDEAKRRNKKTRGAWLKPTRVLSSQIGSFALTPGQSPGLEGVIEFHDLKQIKADFFPTQGLSPQSW